MICVIITSSAKNSAYCALAIDTLLSQDSPMKKFINVLDFSGQAEEFEFLKGRAYYANRKGKGFCANVNHGIGTSALTGADYMLYINDDVRLPPHFISRALFTLSDRKVGFVSGVQQTTDLVCIPADCFGELQFPKSVDVTDNIDDLMGKWGDFSAWMADVSFLTRVGALDERFDPVGILADNDYLLRARNAGYVPKRDYGMMYLHAKGVTQRQYRPGWPNDKVLVKAKKYFMKKWGIDPYAKA